MQFDRLNRREFITLVSGAAAWPLAARAQPAAKAPRVGMLYPGAQAAALSRVEAMLSGLRVSGYANPAQIELTLRVADNGGTTSLQPLLKQDRTNRRDSFQVPR
jgi:putative ABC transport system substrate-binding protein